MPKPEVAHDAATDESARPGLSARVRIGLLEKEVSALVATQTKLVLGQEALGTKIDLIREDIAAREQRANERVETLCGHISRGIEATRKVLGDFKPGVYLVILAAVARLLAGVVETLDIDGWGSVDFVNKEDLPQRDTKVRARERDVKADTDAPATANPEPTP